MEEGAKVSQSKEMSRKDHRRSSSEDVRKREADGEDSGRKWERIGHWKGRIIGVGGSGEGTCHRFQSVSQTAEAVKKKKKEKKKKTVKEMERKACNKARVHPTQ